MTEKQMSGVVSFWQATLGLEGWDIIVDFDEPAGDGNDAEAERSFYYDKATVRFSREWKWWPTRRVHEIVVHELLHLVTRDLDQCHAALEDQLHPHVWSMADARYTHEIEGVVDRLAHRLVAFAGIPD